MPDLLIELFSEEIPARMQSRAAEDLKKRMTDGLVEAGLTYAGAAGFSTPRRLTLAVEGLLAESPKLKDERKGPPIDAPFKAISGYLRGLGLEATQSWYEEKIEILRSGGVLTSENNVIGVQEIKGKKVLFATMEYPSRLAAEIVADVLDDVIRNFPWPKSMRWGAGTLRWVRPLHSILCILTDDAGEAQVVPLDVDGIAAGNTTRGHRFLAPDAFAVTSFDDYAAKLKRASVVLDPAERADHIWQDATNQAFAAGLEVVEDKGLLAEVAGLVEFPVVLMGTIDDDFLDLPPEVLQTSMKEHQKFFSVKNPKTGRIERFITVANTQTTDNGATILAGNQKVLSARLADAKFFWENDLRVAKDAQMQPWLDSLKNVTFHNKLGSQAERIDRIAALAREIAPVVGADADLAEQAARVAKADLSSEMVYEFPELQGLMGRYYAEAAGMPPEVAQACEEHYSPLGPTDTVPTAPVSVAVALADKLDTLTGFWAIDEKPTGSKDPFALRRAALGVIRLVWDNDVRLPLRNRYQRAGKLQPFFAAFVRHVRDHLNRISEENQENVSSFLSDLQPGHQVSDPQIVALVESMKSTTLMPKWRAVVASATVDLLSFFHDRLKVYLRDQGIRHDVIDACIAMEGNDDLTLLVKRATALSDFLKTDDGENLLQGFKRANNILTQAEEKDGVEYSYGADVKFAETEEEKALFAALDTGEPAIEAALKSEDFAGAMGAMAALRAPIDGFFEGVQVNTDNDIIRRNRLNLLSRIRQICLQAADLTRIEG